MQAKYRVAAISDQLNGKQQARSTKQKENSKDKMLKTAGARLLIVVRASGPLPFDGT
jgi:hypothetical protein